VHRIAEIKGYVAVDLFFCEREVVFDQMLLAFGHFFQFNNAFSKRETFLGTDLLLGYIRVQGTKTDNNKMYPNVG